MAVDELSNEELRLLTEAPEDNLAKQRARAGKTAKPAPRPPSESAGGLGGLSREELLAAVTPAPRPPAKPATSEFHLTEFGGAENKAGPYSQAAQDQDERERAEANGVLVSGGGERDLMDGGSEGQRRYIRRYQDVKAGEDAARGFAGVAAGNLAGPLLSRLPGVSSALARGGGAGMAARVAVGAGEGVAGSLPQAESPQDIATGALVGSALRAGGGVAEAIRSPLRATGRTIRSLEAAGMEPSGLPGRAVKGTHNPDSRSGPWRNPIPPEQTGRPHGEAGTEQMAGEAEAAVKENMGLRGALNSDSLGEAKNDLASRLDQGWDSPIYTGRALRDLGEFVAGTKGSSGDPQIEMMEVRRAARNLVSTRPPRGRVHGPTELPQSGDSAADADALGPLQNGLVVRGERAVGMPREHVDGELVQDRPRLGPIPGEEIAARPSAGVGPARAPVVDAEVMPPSQRPPAGRPTIDVEGVRQKAPPRPGTKATRVDARPVFYPNVSMRELDNLQMALNDNIQNPPPSYGVAGAKKAQGLVSRTMREADPLHGPDPDTIGGALDRYGAEKDQLKRMNDIIERMPNDASPADNVGKESQARRFFEQAGQETRAGRAPEYDELAALDPVADVHVRRMRGRNAAESLRLKPPKWLGPRPDVNVLRTVAPSQNVEALAIRYGIPLSVAAEVLAPFSGSAQAGRNQRRGAHLEIFGE